ncbi:hypothetical protein B0H63DRAFT_525116 [Podospora didyma]|uniref:Hyaluronan/mRNA-binding protein domain-containing protein n=1 Tax=Podospora didyma TaxID=330526 RepID=A0AAE0KKA3_9PEZI|nr:hypothetical protein B0H63DRAFT_525116 [Podospora didyma]
MTLTLLDDKQSSYDRFNISISLKPNHQSQSIHPSIIMTRSHKYNDKDHAGIAEGSVLPQENIPKFFAKNGFADVDPKKTKKNGGGKGNWGNAGEEVIDEPFNFVNARRRSNSSSFSTHPEQLKTKFEFNEPEPVFEESLHGPGEEDEHQTEGSSSTASDEDKVVKDM